MNPYGTTRQAVGGNNYRYEIGRKHWWDTVPFRPCRPPTPPWIIDWPVEVGDPEKIALFQNATHCGPGNDLGIVFGDATSGLVLPPGPLSVTGQGAVTQNDPARRTWVGRIRQAGTGLRSIAYSPIYTGPAFVRWLNFGFQPAAPTGDTDSYYFGAVAGGGTSQFKVASASLPIPAGITFFDNTIFSDNEAPRTGLTHLNELEGSSGPSRIELNTYIPWSTFSLWAMANSIGVNAIALSWEIVFQPANVGPTQSSQTSVGGNQFNMLQYLGYGSRGLGF